LALKPQLTVEEGSLKVEVYGGYGEIGGNCVVIRDRDRKLVFDNGIRFQVLRRYYHGRIQPLGVVELRSTGVIPPREVFEGADAVYISHLHLDHLGLLGALPPGVKVYVPSLGVLEALESWYRAAPTWLAEVPHRQGVELAELKPYQDDGSGVTPIPVSHSAYPSFALAYRGYDRTLFYSGDLRLRGPLGPRADTLESIARAVDPGGFDVALLEGTNLGAVETPIGPEEFKAVLSRLLAESRLAVVSLDPLDFEAFSALWELALFSGRDIVIASHLLLDVLPYWLRELQGAPSVELAAAVELESPPPPAPIGSVSLLQDVLRNPERFLVIQEPVGFLEMARRLRLWGEKLPGGTVAVLTTPEPRESWLEAEEEVLASWLHQLGASVYRVRLSGHYHPHELGKILGALKPKKVIPIHTKHPAQLLALAKAGTALQNN